MAHRPAMERVCSISCEQMHTRRTGENVCGACDDTSQARCSYRLPCAEDNATEDRAAAARLLRAADLHGPGLRFRGSPAQTDSWERSTAALVPGKAEWLQVWLDPGASLAPSSCLGGFPVLHPQAASPQVLATVPPAQLPHGGWRGRKRPGRPLADLARVSLSCLDRLAGRAVSAGSNGRRSRGRGGVPWPTAAAQACRSPRSLRVAARRRGQDGLGGRIKRVQPGGGGDSPSRAGLAWTWPSRVKEADRGKVDGNACRPGLENSRKLQPVQYEQPARRRRPRASETGADLAGPEPQTSAGLGGREGCNRPRAPAPGAGQALETPGPDTGLSLC